MTPIEFSKLDIKKQAHHLTLLYFKGQCFQRGKPVTGYFQLRSTFLKAKQEDLNEMFLYLSGTNERPSLKELWQGCKLWNQEKIQSHAVSDYEPLSVEELCRDME